MHEFPTPRLSGLVDVDAFSTPTDRRTFISRASALSLAIPGLGTALVGCSSDVSGGTKRGIDSSQVATTGTAPAPGRSVHNSDSRLDSAVLKDARREGAAATTASPGALAGAFHRFDPTLPAPSTTGRVQLHWHAREALVRITPDLTVAAWTFEGDIPGPLVHCRVGDTVEFTLTNDVDTPHSMDFHAAQIDPKTAFKSVSKGQSTTFTFKPKYAGAFMYHCGTAPVLMHIGSGMHGALIVSPREALPVAKEFVLVQQEYYLADAVNGVRGFDYQKMLTTMPDFVTFNGRPDQYVKDPIKVKVGDRVRFWVVAAGPTHPSHFHIVGDQFDTVYLGSPPGSAIHGVQTWSVAAGGGICFELMCDIAGEFPFVNHGFGHGQKGTIGILSVE